jgi:hypothetical protein
MSTGHRAKPAAIAYDAAVQDRLWELSEQWTGCKFE